MVNVLITGVAGFIGSTLALRLLERGDHVYGIDNLNDYYDVSLERGEPQTLPAAQSISIPEAGHR